MLYKFLFLFTLIFIGPVFSQDTSTVLFVGNSYTTYNNLPSMVHLLADSFGDTLIYDQRTQGGATFQTHASNNTTYTKIKEQSWDYVIMQAQSQEPAFPDSQVDTQTIPYLNQMADSVHANYACSELMMYMTWGRKNGDPQWGPISSYEGMQSRLRNAYMRMADSVDGVVAPVGAVWKYIRDFHPSIELYSPDESHPSFAGSYVAACTFYASLFKKSPLGSSYIGSLSTVEAQNIQQAVQLVVLDSLSYWEVAPNTSYTTADFSFVENGLDVDFSNESDQADSFQWDFGDGNTSSSTHPSNSYNSNGQYTVELIATSMCDSDTVEYILNLNSAGIDENSIDVLQQGKGQFFLKNSPAGINVSVYTLNGQKLKTHYSQESNILTFNQRNWTQYVLIVEGENEIIRIKLPVSTD